MDSTAVKQERQAPMTTATDQFTDYTSRTQEAVTTAIRTWADTVQSVAGAFAGAKPALPEAKLAVDRYFDFVQQVLDSQRQFATVVLDVSTKAAESATEQAKSAVNNATEATKRSAKAASSH